VKKDGYAVRVTGGGAVTVRGRGATRQVVVKGRRSNFMSKRVLVFFGSNFMSKREAPGALYFKVPIRSFVLTLTHEGRLLASRPLAHLTSEVFCCSRNFRRSV
jgi:hypothetical protein